MAIGKPNQFQPGQKKPPNSGRQKGVANKEPRLPIERLNNRIRRHVDRVMQRHEAGIDKIEDPVEALKRDAQLTRDLVELMRFTSPRETSEHVARMSSAQVEAEARRQGPVSDEECMREYHTMCQGDSDAARVAAARLELSRPEQVPEMLRDCRALREALAAGRFELRAEVSLAELFKVLTPAEKPPTVPQRVAAQTTSEFEHSDVGIPVGDGVRLIPATPPQLREREPYPDPPGVPVPIDAEPPTYAREATGARPVDWDDENVAIVLGPMQRF
jgi:hypothetical protein